MYTVYSLYNPYGNYLDNYYVRDYNSFISFLLETSADIHKQDRVNLGILDGVTIRNNLKGDYREYNVLIVEDEDGNRDLYKITGKTFVRRDIWSVEARLDAFSKHYTDAIQADVLVQRLGYKEFTDFSPILFNDEGFTLSNIKKEQHGISFTRGEITNNSTHVIGDDIKLMGYVLVFAKDALQTKLDNVILKTTEYIPTPDYEVDTLEELPLFSFYLMTTNTETFKVWYMFRYSTSSTSADTSKYIPMTLKLDHGITSTITYGTETTLTTRNDSLSKYVFPDEDAGLTDERYANCQSLFYMDVKSNITSAYSYEGWNIDFETMNRRIWTKATEQLRDMLDLTYKNRAVSWTRSKTQKYNGAIVLETSTGKYYKVTLKAKDISSTAVFEDNEDIYYLVYGDSIGYRQPCGTILVNTETTDGYEWSFTETFPSIEVSKTVTMNTKMNTIDEGNPVIFIPYIETDLDVNIKLTTGETLPYNQSTLLQIIRKIQTTYSGENAVLLDVQKVPFFELPYSSGITPTLTINENNIELYLYGENLVDYYEIDKDDSEVYLLRWALPYAQNILTTDTATINIENYKIEQMNKYILRSPSGSSTEEFDPVKNKGVKGWQLKYNIRPYESMYQLQATYEGYYGANFTDTRGTIMLEDTSLTMYSSEWETYVRQNINYVNSFESNINYEQSQLALQQDYEKQSFKIQRIQSGLNAAINWASSGATAVGQAAIGDLGKAIGSANEANTAIASEAVNAATSKKQLKLQLQYETDQLALQQAEDRKQWQYSLGNIQALPLNTDKTCAIYNTNYGVFYYEKYTPTDYELYVYKMYLDLFGITIGQVLSLTDITFDYIEGSVVKYNKEITYEEYEELQEELKEGRRLYKYVS